MQTPPLSHPEGQKMSAADEIDDEPVDMEKLHIDENSPQAEKFVAMYRVSCREERLREEKRACLTWEMDFKERWAELLRVSRLVFFFFFKKKRMDGTWYK